MEKKKIPTTILLVFVVLNLLHLAVSNGESIFGRYVLYLVPAIALLMILAAVGFTVSLFICYEKESRKKIFYVLSILMLLLSISPAVLGGWYVLDLAEGTITEEAEFYEIGNNSVFLNQKKETIAVQVTNRQKKFLVANEPPRNVNKEKILESGSGILAHEERIAVEYYNRTHIAKSVTYLRNK